MSWERDYDKEEFIVCPCGEGKIVRRVYSESNDWGQSESGEYGEQIVCDNCSYLYHVEKLVNYVPAPKWKEDGRRVSYYLVPNGMTLKPQKEKRDFYFNFEELVVSNYSIDEIKNVIEDMKTNKYSTRLQNKDSDKIVGWHVRWYKKKNIYDIILKLQKCIEDYDRYEWSKEKYNAFIEEENSEIEKEAIRIKKVEDLSIKIVF